MREVTSTMLLDTSLLSHPILPMQELGKGLSVRHIVKRIREMSLVRREAGLILLDRTVSFCQEGPCSTQGLKVRHL